MKTHRAKRIRAMRERMEKVATGRVAEASQRLNAIETQRTALENEMRDLHASACVAGQSSGGELFIAAATLEKGRRRVSTLVAERDEAADILLTIESDLYDARRATKMADRLCQRLMAADQARREKNEQELSDDAGARIVAASEDRKRNPE